MFEEEVIPTTKGLQGSKWDQHYPKFNEPGKTLWAPLEQMSGQEASQFAARMRTMEARLKGDRKFHSGVCNITKRSFVRVRPPGELVSKEEEKAEEQPE